MKINNLLTKKQLIKEIVKNELFYSTVYNKKNTRVLDTTDIMRNFYYYLDIVGNNEANIDLFIEAEIMYNKDLYYYADEEDLFYIK